MRRRRSKDGLTVNAVAGAHVVLLGWTIADANRPNLRGFAVRRTANGDVRWMTGSETFASVEPSPAPGARFSSLVHPFQTFRCAEAEIEILRRQRLTGPAIARQTRRPVSTIGAVLRRRGWAASPSLNPGYPPADTNATDPAS